MDQRVAPGGDGWSLLGTYIVDSGGLTVQLTNAADGTVVADAIRLVETGAAESTSSLSAGGGGNDSLSLLPTASLPLVSAESICDSDADRDIGGSRTNLELNAADNGFRVDDTAMYASASLTPELTDALRPPESSVTDAAIERLDLSRLGEELLEELASSLL